MGVNMHICGNMHGSILLLWVSMIFMIILDS